MKYTLPTVRDEKTEGVLQEYWRRARPLIIDFLVWITVLTGLAIIYGCLRIFEAQGYDHEKIEFLENVDYIGAAGIVVVGCIDMFMKFVAAAWGDK